MESLRNNLTVSDWISEMNLLFRTPQYNEKIFFTLEGDSDIRFLNTHFQNDKIHFDSPRSGKPEVINAVNTLRSQGKSTVYGLCDADFDILEGRTYDNIHFTDCHDLEMMLIEGGSFDKFISEFIKTETLRQFTLEYIKTTLKDSLINVCYSIGLLKWLNHKLELNLMFKGMSYNEFIRIDGFNVSIEVDRYISHIFSRSPRKLESCSLEFVSIELDKLQMLNAPYKYVCNGHDFTYVLMMAFREEYSRERNITQERVESHLRMGYPKESFEQSGIYNHLSNVLLTHSANDN
ncbi:MAG: DUF4435 domain-containing protein [Silvania sp.]|uniref:DUF4435 domain-containing protein n=1 Tax=Silvania sp. TaxID=3016633 RepID=UPI000F9C84C5